jgi:cholinesterase
MKERWKALCALSVLAGWLLPGATFADQQFSQLIIISGSLSDVGNYASVHGWRPAPFYKFRSTNGPNIDDFFAEALNFPDEPSMHLVGPVKGNNFAVFQSLAGGHGPEDLPAQIQAYLGSRAGKADPKALHLLLIGGSDVINAFLEPNDAKSSQILDAAVDGMEHAIKTLAAAGAKTIYAPNFTDLGATPFAVKNHVEARGRRISVEYNTKYAKMLDRVDHELHIDLIRWDFFAWSEKFLTHVHEFGFTNTTGSCLAESPTYQCGDLSKFLFLDDFFPTARAHRLFGIAMTENFIEHEKNAAGAKATKTANGSDSRMK